MTNTIKQAIEQIIQAKRARNIHPAHALYSEISAAVKLDSTELKKGLNELVEWGVLEWGKTLSGFYFVSAKKQL